MILPSVSEVSHVEFDASMALEREKDAKQIVGTRDHGDGKGSRLGSQI